MLIRYDLKLAEANHLRNNKTSSKEFSDVKTFKIT